MRFMDKIREKINEVRNYFKKEKKLHSLFETEKEQKLFIKALEENMFMTLHNNERWDVYKTESLEYEFQSNSYVAKLHTAFAGNMLLVKVYKKENFSGIWSKPDYVKSLHNLLAHPQLSFYYPFSQSRLDKWKKRVN